MKYSRRNFLKAAGSGAVVLTTVGTSARTASAAAAPLAIAAPTTLWEVISVKLGLTGTNRSCNRGSCGACSVVVDGTPLYSCHTLATEVVGKKILTVEGLGDERNLHPLQRIGHMYVAADCGFCTPGWIVTA